MALIWIDLEMTGLQPEHEVIIEIATIVTDQDLNIIAEGPSLAIKQADTILENMSEWCKTTHAASGLLERVRKSTVSVQEAESLTLDFLQQYVPAKTSPMCGNSICLDRRFLYNYMPKLEAYFHYRHIDVSTVKELARMWMPVVFEGHQKKGTHQAREDVLESIEELRYYHKYFKTKGVF